MTPAITDFDTAAAQGKVAEATKSFRSRQRWQASDLSNLSNHLRDDEDFFWRRLQTVTELWNRGDQARVNPSDCDKFGL
jgi:hypothetical protein